MTDNILSPISVDGDITSSGRISSGKQGDVIGTLSVMPSSGLDAYTGITVQYIGETDSNFVKNALYRCNGTAWVKVSIGDDTVGSATQPIYMNAGVPTPTSQALNDSTITIKSAGGATVGDFTLNQASSENIVLPASAIQASDVSVTFALQGSPDYADYPYRGQYAVANLTADDYAEVTFSPAQVASGYYAPFCKTVSGYVYMYASSNVGTVTIPTISIGNYESNPDHSDPAWNTKVGKIETSGLHAYTHNGADQGDMTVTSASTASTIMQRDASGSTQVADTPTNTHSTVNQAYVESTVDGINNLVHKSGSEEITGQKTVDFPIFGSAFGQSLNVVSLNSPNASDYYELFNIDTTTVGNRGFLFDMYAFGANNTRFSYGQLLILYNGGNAYAKFFNRYRESSNASIKAYKFTDANSIEHFAFRETQYCTLRFYLKLVRNGSSIDNSLKNGLNYINVLATKGEPVDVSTWTEITALTEDVS